MECINYIIVVDYTTEASKKSCVDVGCENLEFCCCSLCSCCCVCAVTCTCTKAGDGDPDVVVENILGLGGDEFRF